MSERLRDGWRNCSRSGISPSNSSTTIRSLCTWQSVTREHSGQGVPRVEENEMGLQFSQTSWETGTVAL